MNHDSALYVLHNQTKIHVYTILMILSVAGNTVVDNIFEVLLSTNMFVGGVTGFILDNTIPGKWLKLLFLEDD